MTEEQFAYLDELRESGVTNMFGAAPYLEDEFGITRAEAEAILLAWIRTFGDGKASPADRVKQGRQTLDG